MKRGRKSNHVWSFPVMTTLMESLEINCHTLLPKTSVVVPVGSNCHHTRDSLVAQGGLGWVGRADGLSVAFSMAAEPAPGPHPCCKIRECSNWHGADPVSLFGEALTSDRFELNTFPRSFQFKKLKSSLHLGPASCVLP